MEVPQDVYRFEVEKLEMKLGYLQLLNLDIGDLLKFLKIDLEKAVAGLGRLECPRCRLLPNEAALVIIHKDFTRSSPLLQKVRVRDGDSIQAMTTDYYLCECGCIYKFFTGHKKAVRKG